jgi:hypothetical protein
LGERMRRQQRRQKKLLAGGPAGERGGDICVTSRGPGAAAARA